MADIAKCNDALCPSKEYCYRFTAPASIYQSYADFSLEDDEMNCSYFYPNGKCKYCNLENDNHKMSCPIMKIQVNL
jgi:hypothetical protein